MTSINRRQLLRTIGASAASVALTQFSGRAESSLPKNTASDSLPMQLYKSMSDEQKEKVCLPIDHPRRQYVSNWWYIHKDYRIPGTFNDDQQQLIQQIFDSLHTPEYREAINEQVEIDQYGQVKNAPAVGFFGTPDDEDFEFLYTGHHVTRRCNAHTDKGQGFGGAPIFYGHFRDAFNETSEHIGNPYWYQGKLFNKFVDALNETQQKSGLVSDNPRSEKSSDVIKKRTSNWPGLSCAELSDDQKALFVETIRDMMAMFRNDDVEATIGSIQKQKMVDQLYVSWFDGKYDVGGDKVWDTWQIEGPDMVWYFRGQPHIHSYFHLKS